MRNPAKVVLGLAVVVVIGGALFVALEWPRWTRAVPAPKTQLLPFALPTLADDGQTFSPAEMKGQVWLLNLWASWCTSCQLEHPLFVELAQTKLAPIVGLNFKDRPDDARAWLRKLGNPYRVTALDRDGQVAIAMGVFAVPATFVIDADGFIRYARNEPVTAETLRNEIIPLVRTLQTSTASPGSGRDK